MPATVAAAAEADAHPVSRLVGSRTVEPVVTVDAGRLDDALRKVLGDQAQGMTMPAITYQGTTPKVGPAQAGAGPGPASGPPRWSAPAGWPGSRSPCPWWRPTRRPPPEELDRLVTELAKPAVAAPVTLRTDKGSVTVPPAAIAKSLRFTADKTGKLTPSVDVKRLRAALGDDLDAIEVPPKDATMTISGGRPKVIDGRAGPAAGHGDPGRRPAGGAAEGGGPRGDRRAEADASRS